MNIFVRTMKCKNTYLQVHKELCMFFWKKKKTTKSELSVVLEYSKTSISRALNELSDHGLIYAESTNSMKIGDDRMIFMTLGEY